MNNFIIQMVILLFIGLGLSEISSLIYFLWPNTAKIEFDLFLDRAYKQKLTVLWYIFELGQILNRILWAYAFCRISERISHKLHIVSVIFFWYYISQFLFYVWNRNTSFMANYFLYTAMGLIFIEMFVPNKKMAKIKSIE